MSNGSTYQCALVGLGKIAWQLDEGRPSSTLTHLGALQSDTRTEVIAGMSPVAAERDAFASATGLSTCESLEELLAGRPDIVSICSPSEFHAAQTLRCIEAGVPMVWLEKPPAASTRELDDMIAAGEASDVTTILVNYMRRYAARYAFLKSSIRDGAMGSLRNITATYSRGLELNGSHFIDLIFFLLDGATDYEVTVSDQERAVSCPTFTLHVEGVAPISFVGCEVDYHINDVVLTFDEGRLSLLSGGLDARVERKRENEVYEGFYRLRESDEPMPASESLGTSFPAALSDLIESHEANRDPQSSLRTARATQDVIEKIRGA